MHNCNVTIAIGHEWTNIEKKLTWQATNNSSNNNIATSRDTFKSFIAIRHDISYVWIEWTNW